MRKNFFMSLAFIVMFSGICLADENRQLFTVQADAIVRVKPEKAVLDIGVITRGKNLAETKQKNAGIVKNAIAYCKKSGIQEKNIQTDYINIRPVYKDYDTHETSFYIEQNLEVILEDISKYDEILTELLNIGVNQVRYVDFQVNDLKKYRNESRKLAIAAAKERAAFLAQEAGITLGNIVNVNDFGSSWYPARYGGMMSNVSQNITQSGGFSGSDSPDTLAPGMIPVKSNIVLTYEIKNK